MLAEERKEQWEKIESAQKIARYSEIIKLCGLELYRESNEPEFGAFVDTIFYLTIAIDLEVGKFLPIKEKENNKSASPSLPRKTAQNGQIKTVP